MCLFIIIPCTLVVHGYIFKGIGNYSDKLYWYATTILLNLKEIIEIK